MEILAKDSEGKITDWEEVPAEDLWQDGEITPNEMPHLLYENIIEEGKWKIVRRKE
jgi:hypothetical protein